MNDMNTKRTGWQYGQEGPKKDTNMNVQWTYMKKNEKNKMNEIGSKIIKTFKNF